MKTKLLLIYLLLTSYCLLLTAQIPQGFNYQAIARDGVNPITTPIGVKITIQSASDGGTIFWVEEHLSVQPNSSGLFSLVIGEGDRLDGTALTFSGIDWTVTPKFLKTEIDYTGVYVTMGTSQLWSVPYSNVAGSLNDTLNRLFVRGGTTNLEEALFEVKNSGGQTIFAVYNEGVRVYVDDGSKGSKGGFAIGGFGMAKGGDEYLRVTRDSTRVYINDLPGGKAAKGGFAIGGFGSAKANYNFFKVDEIKMKGGKVDYLNLTNLNTFIGEQAGLQTVPSGEDGIYNSFMGFQSGYSNTSGAGNVFIGNKSGNKNSGGDNNVFLGNSSGFTNVSGLNNVFIGYYAGYLNTASYNLFLGYEAGRNNSTGTNNTFLGYNAGYGNTSGGSNIFIGYLTGSSSTGSSNIFLGDSAGYDNGNSYNIFIGKGSGKITTGAYNSFFGYQAGVKNTTGNNNLFMGYRSGYSNTTGKFNTFLGYKAGYANPTTSYNTYVGYQAGAEAIGGEYNVAVGPTAGYLNNGDYNVFIGYQSGYNNIGGADARFSNMNTFIGYRSGKGNTTGWHNLAIGYLAGLTNQTATNQFFIGDNSGELLTDGYGNTFVGHLTGSKSTNASSNTFIGYQVGYNNVTGGNNTLVGYAAGIKSTGSDNVMIGTMAGYNIVGSGNVIIGKRAAYNETGSNKLYIDNSDTATPLVLGDFTDGSEKVIVNGKLGIGINPTTKFAIAGLTGAAAGSTLIINGNNVYTLASLRDTKDDIQPLTDDFRKILIAEPVSFRDKATGMAGIGYIAEDFEKNGLNNLLVYENGNLVSLRYDLISVYNLEIIKQQQTRIEATELENLKLRSELIILRNEIDQIKALITK